MSGIALTLQKQGFSISGSDTTENESIVRLKESGIRIFKGQDVENIKKIIQNKNKENLIIVISSAIPQNNQELISAINLNLKVIHRSDALNFLLQNKKSILIAGSHGKTTTSTLITTLFAENNLDPTSIIGGVIPYYNSNSYTGKGTQLIAEIDESDGSISKYNGDLAVITNIDLDHTDHYKNLGSLKIAIKKFASNSKILLANNDCKNLKECFSEKAIWWSTKNIEKIDFAGIPIKTDGSKTIANYYESGKLIDKIKINIPGLHNLNNAIGAIAACRISGINFSEIKNKLHLLKTPKRRFEFKGIWNERQVVEDYAHHPNEVKETISMARLIVNKKDTILPLESKRLVIVFQAHRYKRLKDFMHDFAKYLGKADLLILAPIYSAGEKPIEGIHNKKLKSCILQQYPNQEIIIAESIGCTKNILKEKTKSNDLILLMGAGDIGELSSELIEKNKNQVNFHAA